MPFARFSHFFASSDRENTIYNNMKKKKKIGSCGGFSANFTQEFQWITFFPLNERNPIWGGFSAFKS